MSYFYLPPESVPIRHFAADPDPTKTSVEPLLPLSSPAPTSPWWERHDPFYEFASFTGTPRWTFRHRFETKPIMVSDATGKQRKMRPASPDFLKLGSRLAHRPQTLNAIASLAQYHQLTTNQLAALGGWHPRRSGFYLGPLWAAGLLERCRIDPFDVIGARRDRAWRLLLRAPYYGPKLPLRVWLEEHLDHDDWVRVTVGRDILRPGAGRGHLRHNLLAAEAMLRVLEAVPDITAAWGETLSSARLLLPPIPGRPPLANTPWRADFGLLRKDGFRILVETTMSGGAERTMGEKMLRWGRLLSNYTHSTSGLVVLFLNSDQPRHNRVASVLRSAFTHYLTPERLGEPGAPALPDAVRRARSHILIGSWQEWFPSTGKISERCLRLEAAYSLDGQSFHYTQLANPEKLRFRPANPEWFAPARANLSSLAHHPTWAEHLPGREGDDAFLGSALARSLI